MATGAVWTLSFRRASLSASMPRRRRIANLLYRFEHGFGRKYPIEPAFLEDDRLRLGDRLQRSIGKPSFGKDAEGDGELDIEMADDEIDRGLLGDAPPHRFVRRFAQSERKGRADRFGQRRFENGELLNRTAVRPHHRLVDFARD